MEIHGLQGGMAEGLCRLLLYGDGNSGCFIRGIRV